MALLPNPIDLTTLAAVKSWVKVPLNQTADDDLIQACITAAGMFWLVATGRGNADGSVPALSPFNQPVPYNENYDGPGNLDVNGNSRMFLRNSPIQSVQQLTVNTFQVQQSTAFGQPGWVIDSGGKSLLIRGGGGGSGSFTNNFFPLGSTSAFFRKGGQNINVQYTAGFPGQLISGELQAIPTPAGNPPRSIIVVSRPWLSDAGVVNFQNGAQFAKSTLAPLQGQYFLLGGGQYLFNSADAGTSILISYNSAGTPPDIEIANRQMVALNYKRRDWIGLKSRAMGGNAGSTTYGDWIIPPEAMQVLSTYKRLAITG